jgi:hypothetical protein
VVEGGEAGAEAGEDAENLSAVEGHEGSGDRRSFAQGVPNGERVADDVQ